MHVRICGLTTLEDALVAVEDIAAQVRLPASAAEAASPAADEGAATAVIVAPIASDLGAAPVAADAPPAAFQGRGEPRGPHAS